MKLIEPGACATSKLGSKKAPQMVIEFVPRVMRNVGIGWVDERAATAIDMKKLPVVRRPWINPEHFV